MNVLVELLYSLRQGFLTIFCAMDPFESGKSSIPLLTKMYLNTHTKKNTQTIHLVLQCTTKETNYAQIHFSKYSKINAQYGNIVVLY